MPKFYKKKPVVIEALKYTGENTTEVMSFCKRCFFKNGSKKLIIVTLEGDMVVSKGDYIIKGIANEFYPCKPAIFKLTYEDII
jgi:hypothetical protein